MPVEKNEKTNNEKINDVLKRRRSSTQIEFTEYQQQILNFRKRLGKRLVDKLAADITTVEEPLWCEWTRTETTRTDEPSDSTLPYAEGNREYKETVVVEHGYRSPLIVAVLDAIAFASPHPMDPLYDKRCESPLQEMIREALDAVIKVVGVYATMKATAPASSTVSPPAAVPVPPPVNPDDPCGCSCVDFNNTQKPGA
jgi:hypothetical protein